MAIIDFYDDSSGAILREILEEHGAEHCPEHVRKCAHLIPADAFRDEGSLFAWPERKRFRIDNPSDTWLSREYFVKTARDIPAQLRPPIERAITQAGEMFGLGPRIKQATAEVLPIFLVDRPERGIRLYPIHDPEHVAKSAAWFPRNLTGELAPLRRKVAHELFEACARFGVNPGDYLIEELRPIKRSNLLAHLHQRLGLLEEERREGNKGRQLTKAAARKGVDLPYRVSTALPDERFITIYTELVKRAQLRRIDEDFWDLFEQTDKLAGMEQRPDVTPACGLRREVEDDLRNMTCKLAGTIVSIPQVLDRVSREMWADLAPELLGNLHDFDKVASTLEGLDDIGQKIIYARLRGY